MPTTHDPRSAAAAESTRGGKYLTFVLAGTSFGIEVRRIREIIRSVSVTTLPGLPDYVRGVINLRGRIVPVIDLRVRFQLPVADTTERTCIIVVEVRSKAGAEIAVGLVVDDVEEVTTVHETDFELAPDFGVQVDTRYIRGMAKIKDTVKTLLDIDHLLSAQAVDRLRKSTAA